MTTSGEPLPTDPDLPVARRPRHGGTRERLLRAVQDEPGIPIAKLHQRLDTGWGTIYNHLEKLLDEGFLRVEQDDRCKRIYPSREGDLATDALGATFLRTPTARRIGRAILAEPGCDCSRIAESLGISCRVVRYHLERLTGEGLVKTSPSRVGYTGLEATPRLRLLLGSRQDAPTTRKTEG